MLPLRKAKPTTHLHHMMDKRNVSRLHTPLVEKIDIFSSIFVGNFYLTVVKLVMIRFLLSFSFFKRTIIAF